MKRKIILLLVTLWISIFIISGCSMMPHLNASAQTVIDTKKELLAEIENALSSRKTKISFVTSDLDQTDFDSEYRRFLWCGKGISDKECKVFE